jgi:tRNA-binding EMAP/Myf-like protein
MITIEDFGKIEIRVGLVAEAVNKEGSEKLIRLVVDFGDEKRIIFYRSEELRLHAGGFFEQKIPVCDQY